MLPDIPTVRHVRAFVVRGGGADYHDQSGPHWITSQIATPMSKYPNYRSDRRLFGIDVLGSLVIEIEATDGTIGFAVTTGGEIGAFIVERHLSRFVEGQPVTDLETIWDQMFNATIFYGRKGIVMNAVSGVDLALWDLLGKVRGLPVYELLGGRVREELVCYATGPRPDLAEQMGFIGGKMPLRHSPAEAADGLSANIAQFQQMRTRVADDFWLMIDCWMSLDVDYAVQLAEALKDSGLKWLEECLMPDDYTGYAQLRSRMPSGTMLTTGEHESTRWGFGLLLDMKCCDLLQPDVGWCGGLSELLKIADIADTYKIPVVPHGSSVYSYHFAITRKTTTFTEFLMMAPQGDRIVPMFAPLLLDEPVPVDGRIVLSSQPGFGVRLNRACSMERPYSH